MSDSSKGENVEKPSFKSLVLGTVDSEVEGAIESEKNVRYCHTDVHVWTP